MNPFVLVLSENYQGCSKYLKVLSCPGSSSSCVCAQRRVVRYRTEAIVTQGSVAVKAVRLTFTCLCVFLHDTRFQLILTWQGRHHDHEGGSPSARLSHCTPCFADPSEFPKCGNLDCIISGSGGLRSRSPLIYC